MIHQDEQFTHEGHQSDLGGFTCETQALIKLLENGVGTRGNQGGHVKCASESRTSAAGKTAALPLPAFSWMGCQARQGGRLAAIECSQFGHFCQHRQGSRGAYASNRLECLHPPIQDRDLRAEFLELFLDLFQCRFQMTHQTLGLAAQAAQSEAIGLLSLGDQHFQELFAATDQFGQLLLVLGTRGSGFGVEGLAIIGQNLGIEGIGFGALALGTSEKPDASRVKDADGDGGLVQGRDQFAFITAGGFTDDLDSRDFGQEFKQSAIAGVGVGQVMEATGQVKLQVKLGNIQADIDSSHCVLAHSCKYELALVSRSINGSSLGHRSQRFWLPHALGENPTPGVTNSVALLPFGLQAERQFHLPIGQTPDKDRRNCRYKGAIARRSPPGTAGRDGPPS